VEQAPFIYLVNRNALSAISSFVHGGTPVILRQQTFWNAERLTLSAAAVMRNPMTAFFDPAALHSSVSKLSRQGQRAP
jgi:hypothetical protein